MTYASLLDRFKDKRALVIGDLMLDEYIFGRAARISPEAPVMVIRQQSTAQHPGGAANVALNLIALGAQVSLIGVIGCDPAGEALRQTIREKGVDEEHLLIDPHRPTTRKTRIVADHSHQVLRIDHEFERPLEGKVEDGFIDTARRLIEGQDIVVLSDYLKGSLTPNVVRSLIDYCATRSVPVVANPKPRSLLQYAGASLVSLNRSEAAEATAKWDGLTTEEAGKAAYDLKERYHLQSILVTLGEDGMIAAGPTTFRVEAPRVEVYDTAGAGDTVVATVALGLASAGFQRQVFELAALTAASVVKRVGVATPSEQDLAEIRG